MRGPFVVEKPQNSTLIQQVATSYSAIGSTSERVGRGIYFQSASPVTFYVDEQGYTQYNLYTSYRVAVPLGATQIGNLFVELSNYFYTDPITVTLLCSSQWAYFYSTTGMSVTLTGGYPIGYTGTNTTFVALPALTRWIAVQISANSYANYLNCAMWSYK
jgi:hypothetical protein